MSGRQCRVLILDWDENTLIALQHVLEDGGVDTTITWDEAEARKSINSKTFHLLLIADHLPNWAPNRFCGILFRFRAGAYCCWQIQWAPSRFADWVSVEYSQNEGPSKFLSRCRRTGRRAAAVLALRPSQLPRTHVRRRAVWNPSAGCIIKNQ
jgi:CheY-like chemotaxis protein